MQTIAREPGRQLCAVLGHELRNPLASVMTNLMVAMELTDGDDPRAAFLGRARQDLERVSKLLSTYLDFGGEKPRHHSSIEAGSLLDCVARRYEERVVTADIAADHLSFSGDRDLLERVFENLIDNAFGAGARSVKLEVKSEDGDAVFDVSDDGPGVSEDLRNRLFEPFVSGRGSSGIGLAVARDVLKAHGGKIDLLPSSGGARFRVTLPLP